MTRLIFLHFPLATFFFLPCMRLASTIRSLVNAFFFIPFIFHLAYTSLQIFVQKLFNYARERPFSDSYCLIGYCIKYFGVCSIVNEAYSATPIEQRLLKLSKRLREMKSFSKFREKIPVELRMQKRWPTFASMRSHQKWGRTVKKEAEQFSVRCRLIHLKGTPRSLRIINFKKSSHRVSKIYNYIQIDQSRSVCIWIQSLVSLLRVK